MMLSINTFNKEQDVTPDEIRELHSMRRRNLKILAAKPGWLAALRRIAAGGEINDDDKLVLRACACQIVGDVITMEGEE